MRTSAMWLDYPYPRPGSEGLILYESLLVKHGGDIYAPITPGRFISGPYPPVFYWLAAAAIPDSLPDFSNLERVTSIFRPGRSIALFSTLLAAALLVLLPVFEGGYALRGRKRTLLAAAGGLVGGALLLSLPQVLVWATRFRGDMFMIALTAFGLLLVAVGAPSGQRGVQTGPLVAAAIFFGLAFYTKQTAIAGPAAAAAYLLLRDWKSGLKWCAGMLGVVVLPFLILDISTGNWFYLKMVVYHSLPFVRSTFTRLIQFGLVEDQWPLLLAGGLYSLVRLVEGAKAFRQRRAYSVPLLVPLFLLSSLVTLPTGGVAGADHNHLLMTGLANCAACGSLVAWLIAGARSQADNGPSAGALPLSPALPALASAAIYAVLLGYVLFTSEPSGVGYGPDLAMRTPAEQEQLRKITLYAQGRPGSLLFSDDPGVVALAGKSTPYDDPFTMTALARLNRWDEAEFRGMLRNGEFSTLVLSCDVPATVEQRDALARGQKLNVGSPCRSDTFTDGVLDAINSGYTLLFRDVLFTYVPKPK